MKPFFLIVLFAFQTAAQAGVIHIDHPVYPGTPLAFSTYTPDLESAGTGGPHDRLSRICWTLGYGLSKPPYENFLTDFGNQPAVDIYNRNQKIEIFDIRTVVDQFALMKVVTQINCDDTPSPYTHQDVGYYSAIEVQSAFKSNVPVQFELDSVIDSTQPGKMNSSDPFCIAHGFNRSGTPAASGISLEGHQTNVAVQGLKDDGTYYVKKSAYGYAHGVVCTKN